VNNFWKLLTLFLLGCLVVLVITHSSGFAQSAGTLFTGVNALGTTLTGAGIAGGMGTSTSKLSTS
jgi:hypothetical protein